MPGVTLHTQLMVRIDATALSIQQHYTLYQQDIEVDRIGLFDRTPSLLPCNTFWRLKIE